MFLNTSVCIILMFVAISLSSCDGEIPKGDLSKTDLYGNWVYESEHANITILFRKDVYRVRILWKDGTKYESDWEEWRLEYSDPNNTYEIRFSNFAPYLYCNWEEDSRTERITAPTENEASFIEKTNDIAHVYSSSGRVPKVGGNSS